MILRAPITRILAMFVFGCVLSVAMFTNVQAADREKLTAFLNVTGFDVSLDSIALSAAQAPMMLGMSEGDFGADWSRTAEDVFAQKNLRGMAIDILEQTLTDDLLTHAAEFYASPLGQKLVEVENASHMFADDEAKRTEGEKVLAGTSDERAALLARMVDGVNTSGVAVRAVQEIQVRFLMAASNAGVFDFEIDEQMLRGQLKESEEELRDNLRTSGLIGSAYTYQDISDQDLERYVVALEEPEMQRVYELLNAVQYEVMANRFEVLAGRMAEMHPGQEL